MTTAFFVSDLHGRRRRYDALFAAVASERPDAVFLGGDLFPHAMAAGPDLVSCGEFHDRWATLRDQLGASYPEVFFILGNDDPHALLDELEGGEGLGLWRHAHDRILSWGEYSVLGYACVPPTPFLLKDWERYDVSRFVDPGCIPPEDGRRTDHMTEREVRLATIKEDLARIAGDRLPDRTIGLFHSPPYRTDLDRAALDGKTVDHAPLDVHIGSLAIKEFIEERGPAVTLHGHVHESARLTGRWSQEIAATVCLGGAHDGPELSLVRFDPENPTAATRELV